MPRLIALTAAFIVLAAAPGRAAGEGRERREEIVDHGLADAEAFARYADVARTPAAAAAAPVPAVGPFAPRPPAAPFRRYRPEPERAPRALPLPPAPRAGVPSPRNLPASPRAGSSVRPSGPSWDPVPLIGALGIGLSAAGLFLLAGASQSTSVPPPPPPPQRAPRPPAAPPRPIPRLALPPPAPAPPPRPPEAEPPAPPAAGERRPVSGPRMPWWAITYEEQQAIERWDRSVEKEFGMLSLPEWLDAHAHDLKGVNAWRLKEKLWRDLS